MRQGRCVATVSLDNKRLKRPIIQFMYFGVKLLILTKKTVEKAFQPFKALSTIAKTCLAQTQANEH